MRTRPSLLLMVTLATSSCAATYVPPKTIQSPISVEPALPRDALLRSVKQTLTTEGYQITAIDDAAGTVSTAVRAFRITPDQADCGNTMGINYLRDKRTSTRVGFGIVVSESGRLSVRATIEGEYKPSFDFGLQDISLTCVSKGVLEKEMIEKIVAGASA